MNEEKSLREEIADVKKMVKAIAAKLNEVEIEMRIMPDERYDKQPKKK